MKSAFLDKLIERFDKLDSKSLQRQFLRLTREKGLLEAIFNSIHEGIIVANREGVISYANNAAQNLLGFSIDSQKKNSISRFIRDIEWDRAFDSDEEETGHLISKEIEVSYPEHRFINCYLLPLSLTSSTTNDSAVLILRDISPEKQREATLLESERFNAVTLLAAGVAHEIGNPLNSLHIHLQLMEREFMELPSENRENLQELLTVARNEVERLNMTITEFLQAIRPSLPDLQKSRIESLIRETLDFMKQEITDKDVLVEMTSAENVPEISVDRNQIKQVFFNIIKNALQAMSGSGLLKIAIFNDDRWLGISFKDSGCGISLEDLGRVFEPYHTTKPKGSGLGLMIVKRIIQDHGGEINIHSKPGEGTTVVILIPLDERRTRLLEAPSALEKSREKKQ